MDFMTEKGHQIRMNAFKELDVPANHASSEFVSLVMDSPVTARHPGDDIRTGFKEALNHHIQEDFLEFYLHAIPAEVRMNRQIAGYKYLFTMLKQHFKVGIRPYLEPGIVPVIHD